MSSWSFANQASGFSSSASSGQTWGRLSPMWSSCGCAWHWGWPSKSRASSVPPDRWAWQIRARGWSTGTTFARRQRIASRTPLAVSASSASAASVADARSAARIASLASVSLLEQLLAALGLTRHRLLEPRQASLEALLGRAVLDDLLGGGAAAATACPRPVACGRTSPAGARPWSARSPWPPGARPSSARCAPSGEPTSLRR